MSEAREVEELVGTPMHDAAKPAGRLRRYLARFDEGEVIRWAFRGLLAGAVGVLLLDLHELSRQRGDDDFVTPTQLSAPVLPPAVRTDGGEGPKGIDPRGNITADEDRLREPVRFELQPGGRLAATGFVDVGAAARFAQELDERAEYVSIVTFNSPGGSLDDAIAIARLIRERGFSTEVPDGAFCASSCPLMLAGGVTRSVGEKAAIGLHQFYALGEDETRGPAQAMSDAQRTTARISRHLAEMGVDPSMWLHALDTPPRSLYYLAADEVLGYRLATDGATAAAE